MKEYVLKGSAVTCRKDFHREIAALMNFPDWYGKNLDALKDVLTDIGEETCLTLTETEQMKEQLGTYYRSVLRVFKDAAEENASFTWKLEE